MFGAVAAHQMHWPKLLTKIVNCRARACDSCSLQLLSGMKLKFVRFVFCTLISLSLSQKCVNRIFCLPFCSATMYSHQIMSFWAQPLHIECHFIWQFRCVRFVFVGAGEPNSTTTISRWNRTEIKFVLNNFSFRNSLLFWANV